MKTYFDCIQCFVRQALDAVRFLTDDESIHEHVLRKILSEASEMEFYQSPPVTGQKIHRMIRELLGDDDPYRDVKDRSNRIAMQLYPELKAKIEQSSNPLELAVRLAIAGNIIDFGVNSLIDESLIYETLDRSVKEPIVPNSIDDFRNAVEQANDILYLGDNAGEIVFDRLLIEQLPHEKVTFVVRGNPVINDITLIDAECTGMTDLVNVIDNGSDAPGTILGDCSPEFLDRFDKSDLIIAKGQGNYESLSDSNKNILYVLMAKCPIIAHDIDCNVGSFILKTSFQELTAKANNRNHVKTM